jgi:hypothetical protein
LIPLLENTAPKNQPNTLQENVNGEAPPQKSAKTNFKTFHFKKTPPQKIGQPHFKKFKNAFHLKGTPARKKAVKRTSRKLVSTFGKHRPKTLPEKSSKTDLISFREHKPQKKQEGNLKPQENGIPFSENTAERTRSKED